MANRLMSYFSREPQAQPGLSDELAAAHARIAQLEAQLAESARLLDRPHFVADYEAYVKMLLENHPLDDAMAFAVGGNYDAAGESIAEVLRGCGLRDGMSVVDLGCGSGRLAKYLGIKFPHLEYLGIDIVQALLDYAATKSPAHFRFLLNHTLSIPAPDASADMVCVFSVFTHLLHQESYVYLEHAKRVLKPGGKIVFSFLESRFNWPIFDGMIHRARVGEKEDQLNMFTERTQIEAWAEHLDMDMLGYDFGAPHSGGGQTVTIFQRRD